MFMVFSVGLGVLLALAVVASLLYWTLRGITRKRRASLGHPPAVGQPGRFLEDLGEALRPYLADREETPFDRATRDQVHRLARNEGGIVGFGSTQDLHKPGALVFVNAVFPALDEERQPTPPLAIGAGYCAQPFLARSIVNVSAMSYGAISRPAVQALARGAGEAGCWLNTGEGGLSPYHLEGGCDLVVQIGSAMFGVRDDSGHLSDARLGELAEIPQVRAFEIKLSQGAECGTGGLLPAAKVVPEIARLRGVPEGRDVVSPHRHRDVPDVRALLDLIQRVRAVTGKPVGIKTALGGWYFIGELCEAIHLRGPESAPDFITVDGGEGGSGAAPQALAEHLALSIDEALPRLVDALIETGLRDRIRVVAAGKLVTPARAAWALAAGADFVNTARGFMFALGCIQARRCHTNTCPSGVATHDPSLQGGLVVVDKALRVAHYCRNLNREIDLIAHACGLRHARELRREHVRIAQADGRSAAFSTLYPYPVTPSPVRP